MVITSGFPVLRPQLRPATAERMAALLGLAPGASAHLGDPAVNLPLGIHYLGLLAARFQDPAVALAGYNAGPAAAVEWARARSGMPLDEWVEDEKGRFLGGFFSRSKKDGCLSSVGAHPKTYFDYSTGVRCCSDAAP